MRLFRPPSAPLFPALRAVILYDRMSAGIRGLHLLQKELSVGDDAIELKPSLWRTDLLRDHDCAWEALLAARDADLILVSPEDETTRHEDVVAWLADCKQNPHEHVPALLFLLGEHGGKLIDSAEVDWAVALENFIHEGASGAPFGPEGARRAHAQPEA